MDQQNIFDFRGRHILVVGASRAGIGAAIAHAFADAGGIVSITGIDDVPAETERQRFPYHRLDVTAEAAISELVEKFESLDVLVNAAAVVRRGQEYEIPNFRNAIEINLVGTFRMCTAFLPHLKKSHGSIVNFASMYGHFGSPLQPGYGASKGGVIQLTRSLAVAWAPYGIRVNAIAPGFILTAQSQRAYDDVAHRDAVIQRTPFGRWGTMEEMTGPTLFLASPAASFVTGVILPVDGGYSVA